MLQVSFDHSYFLLVVWCIRPDESGVWKMHTVYNFMALFVNLFNELQHHKKRPSRRMAERP
jgi:hypothetical protein